MQFVIAAKSKAPQCSFEPWHLKGRAGFAGVVCLPISRLLAHLID